MNSYTLEALEYIAKLADGGMRDALTMLDKCLAYSSELTLQSVVNALGTVEYDTMIDLTDKILNHNGKGSMEIIETIHSDGKDIKQFVKSYIQFLLDIAKYDVGCDWKYLQIPRLKTYENWLENLSSNKFGECQLLLNAMVKLNADIKYSSTAKYDLEMVVMLFMLGGCDDWSI